MVIIPKKPPVKIRPYLAPRDYADMRKVVIIGGGESALAAAETLRFLDFYVSHHFMTPKFLMLARERLWWLLLI